MRKEAEEFGKLTKEVMELMTPAQRQRVRCYPHACVVNVSVHTCTYARACALIM